MFPLSQSAGYAIQALSCLEEPGGQPYLVQVVAQCTGISPSYLSKLMQRLAKNGLIVARRGKNGGVVLARPSSEITLFDLAEAVDGATWRDHCVMGLKDCSDDQPCQLHDRWKSAKESLSAGMRALTLADLAPDHECCTLKCRDIRKGLKEDMVPLACGCGNQEER